MPHKPTNADLEIQKCLRASQSFTVVAGAGSGKTTSLIDALQFVREEFGQQLRKRGQKVACITYTKRARDVIEARLDFDPLFEIATIHSFIWQRICTYDDDIRTALIETIVPDKILQQEEKYTGTKSKSNLKRLARIEELKMALNALPDVSKFDYDDSQYSTFEKGKIGHDDIIEIASHLILNKPILRKIIGSQFPYILVDEAQDTFEPIVKSFNSVCEGSDLPIVGYFGDPMQQIYDEGVGEFIGPEGYVKISKEENFRSSTSVINLANNLRQDIQQIPGPDNKGIVGSVELMLIQAEPPAGKSKRYTEEQIERALQKFDDAVGQMKWERHKKSKELYLVRRMIARRQGFRTFHDLFSGDYASGRAEDEFKNGSHFALKPFIQTLCKLHAATETGDEEKIFHALKEHTPVFNVEGTSKAKTLKSVFDHADTLMQQFTDLWCTQNIGAILDFARKEKLCDFSDRLLSHMDRPPRPEEYDEEVHSEDKGDWLMDCFFNLPPTELEAYCNFIEDNTIFSTQHGVKGEEYEDVLVVFDDTESRWTDYSFTKFLLPKIYGDGTEGQMARSRKLAYVCFTRARINLRIILFCINRASAKIELMNSGLFKEEQISLLN